MKGMKKLLIGLFLVGALVACADEEKTPAAVHIKPATDGAAYLVGVPVDIKVVYDNGSDVTETVAWAKTDGTSFTLTDTNAAAAKVTAVATTGATTITATYTPTGVDAVEVVRTLVISPSTNAPTAIVVDNITVAVVDGTGTGSLTATADYTEDIKDVDVTKFATWALVAPVTGITVDNATGVVTVTAAGEAKVTATLNAIASVEATITAEKKTITHLFIVTETSNIAEVTTAAVTKGQTTQLLAYAIYDSEGTPGPISGAAIKWASATLANVSIDTNGIITGVGVNGTTSDITVESTADNAIKSAAVTATTYDVPNVSAITVSIPTNAATGWRILPAETPKFIATIPGETTPIADNLIKWTVPTPGATGAQIVEGTGVFTATTASSTPVNVIATIAANTIGNNTEITLSTPVYVVERNEPHGLQVNTWAAATDVVVGTIVPLSVLVVYNTQDAATVVDPTEVNLVWTMSNDWVVTGNSVTVGAVDTTATATATIGTLEATSPNAATAIAEAIASVTAVRPALPYPAAPAPLVIIGTGTMQLTAAGTSNTDKPIDITTLSWASGSTATATATVADTGIVTGVIAGKATITPTGDTVIGTAATVHVVVAP